MEEFASLAMSRAQRVPTALGAPLVYRLGNIRAMVRIYALITVLHMNMSTLPYRLVLLVQTGAGPAACL